MNLLPRLARVLGPALLCAIVATACRNNEQGTRPDAAFTPYIPAFTAGHISARAPIIVRVASGQRWRDSSATALQHLFDLEPSVKGRVQMNDELTVGFVPEERPSSCA